MAITVIPQAKLMEILVIKNKQFSNIDLMFKICSNVDYLGSNL